MPNETVKELYESASQHEAQGENYYLQQENFERAITSLQSAFDLFQKASDILNAVQHRSAEENKNLNNCCQQLIMCQHKIGYSYLKQKNLSGALEKFQNNLKLLTNIPNANKDDDYFSNLTTTYLVCGEAFEGLLQKDEALDAYLQGVKSSVVIRQKSTGDNKRFKNLLQHLADIYDDEHIEDWVKAVEYYKSAIKSLGQIPKEDSNDDYIRSWIILHANCARALNEAEQWSEAIKCYEKAISFKNSIKEASILDFSTYYLDLGRCQRKIGELKQAIKSYHDAISFIIEEVKPKKERHYEELSWCFLELGESYLGDPDPDSHLPMSMEHSLYMYASKCFTSDTGTWNEKAHEQFANTIEDPRHSRILVFIMNNLLAEYSSKDFPNKEVKKYFKDETNLLAFKKIKSEIEKRQTLVNECSTNETFQVAIALQLKQLRQTITELTEDVRNLQKKNRELEETLEGSTNPSKRLKKQQCFAPDNPVINNVNEKRKHEGESTLENARKEGKQEQNYSSSMNPH